MSTLTARRVAGTSSFYAAVVILVLFALVVLMLRFIRRREI